MSDNEELTPPAITDISEAEEGRHKETPILDPHRVREARQTNDGGRQHKYPFGYFLLWIVTLASLLLNAVTLRQILNLKQFANETIAEAVQTIEEIQTQTITYTFPVDQTLVIETVIPIDESVEIPIHKEIEVNTSAVATIADLPFIGSVTATVPVSATVPIDEVFIVQFQDAFEITVPVDLKLDIPIAINIADTELYSTLATIKARLLELGMGLNQPLLSTGRGGADGGQ